VGHLKSLVQSAPVDNSKTLHPRILLPVKQ
jgi:hypothetical protein